MFLLAACAAPPAESPTPQAAAEPCFAGVDAAAAGFADYAAAGATVGTHCAGTDHQEIEDIERVVFLGDSVTEGTPPTDDYDWYRTLVTEGLVERFGADLEVSECSEWGARTDDLLRDGDPAQIPECFPEVETRHTLVVVTVGGNDVLAFADQLDAGASEDEVMGMVDDALGLLRDALVHLRDDALFPGGVDIVLGNVFEFTDATGDLAACPSAEALGFTGDYPQMLEGYAYINQAYAAMAVELDVDLVFMHEEFCGHGFHADDPDSPCYRGADTETWFDPTCIHPNETGHEELATRVLQVVDE